MFTHCLFICVCVFLCMSRPKRSSEDHQLGSCSLHRGRTESETKRLAGEEKQACSDPMRHCCCSACITALHSCTSNHYWMGKHWPSGPHSTQTDHWKNPVWLNSRLISLLLFQSHCNIAGHWVTFVAPSLKRDLQFLFVFIKHHILREYADLVVFSAKVMTDYVQI